MNALQRICKTGRELLTRLSHVEVVNVVLGNEGGDMDSFVSTLSFAIYLQEVKKLDNILPVISTTKEEFPLRTDIRWICRQLEINEEDFVFLDEVNLVELKRRNVLQLNLVDHNCPCSKLRELRSCIDRIIDHHKDEMISARISKEIERVGSCTTLIARHLIHDGVDIDETWAKLMLCPILVDTIDLDESKGRTHEYDLQVAQQLKQRISDYSNLYQNLIDARNDTSELSRYQLLIRDMKTVVHPHNDIKIAIPNITMPIEDFLDDEGCRACDKLAKDNDLHCIVLMAAIAQPSFYRQIALFNLPGKSKFNLQIQEGLEQLGQSSPASHSSKVFWTQTLDAKTSRKVVLPLVQQILNNAN